MIRKFLVAAALLALAPSAFAATCSADIEGNDAMKYNVANIDISKSCKTFTINLKHTGQLAKNIMGHNVVIAKTADIKAIDADGMKAGLDNNYIKPGDDRVIAHTRVVGGGESDSVTFDVARLKAGEDYMFFCSYPGHAALMKGTLKLVD